MGDILKMTIEVSGEKEGTASPYWVILEPIEINCEHGVDGFYTIDPKEIASKVTGPFFSRSEAQQYLDYKYHNFSEGAIVYCCSGDQSEKYKKSWEEAVFIGQGEF